MARRYQSPFFQHLRDFGTGRLPTNATLDQQRYVILDTIGKGGMGAVYLAQDTHLSQLIAIKEMGQARLKRTAFDQPTGLPGSLCPFPPASTSNC